MVDGNSLFILPKYRISLSTEREKISFMFLAITFVALGTSLPDTFASKAAAVGEKNADNAIGNITGSNSVNVFLGLGLPWLIAAIYHSAKVS